MVRFTTHISHVLVTDLIAYTIAILSSILVARSLGPELFGLWTLILTFLAYIEAFGRPKTDAASIYTIGSGQKSQETCISINNFITFSSVLPLGGIVVISAYLLQPFVEGIDSINLVNLAAICVLFTFVQFLNLNYKYILIAKGDFGLVNKTKVAQSLTFFLITVIGFHFFSFHLQVLLTATLVAAFSSFLIGYCGIKVGSFFPVKPKKDDVLDLVRRGKHFYLSNVIAELQSSIAKFGAVFFLPLSEVGYLALAVTLIAFALKGSEAVNLVLMPKISAMDKGDRINFLGLVIRQMILISLGTASVLYLLSTHLIVFLYGDGFSPAIFAFKILLIGLCFQMPASTISAFFYSSDRGKYVVLAHSIALCGQAVLLFPLAKLGGGVGLSVVITCGMVFYSVCLAFLVWKNHKIKLNWFLPKPKDFFSTIDILRSLIKNANT